MAYNYNINYLGAVKPEQGQTQANQHTSLCKSATIWPLNTILKINNAKSMTIFQVGQFILFIHGCAHPEVFSLHTLISTLFVLPQPFFYICPPSLVSQIFISSSMSIAVLQYYVFSTHPMCSIYCYLCVWIISSKHLSPPVPFLTVLTLICLIY